MYLSTSAVGILISDFHSNNRGQKCHGIGMGVLVHVPVKFFVMYLKWDAYHINEQYLFRLRAIKSHLGPLIFLWVLFPCQAYQLYRETPRALSGIGM